MNNSDLGIENYSYLELLELFKIKNDFKESNLNKINERIALIHDSDLPQPYYLFYLKAQRIITIVYYLHETNVILDGNPAVIKPYIDQILGISSYEKCDTRSIIEQLNLHIKSDKEDKTRGPVSFHLNQSHPILEQSTPNVVQSTFPNAVAPGYLNSIKRVTHFLNLNLNTYFRSNYYASDPCNFQYIIPSEIKNVVSLRLASIEIPNSWYLLSKAKGNNVFQIEINKNGILKTFDIVIPDGNYDNNTLAEYLNSTYFYDSGTTTELVYIEYSIDQYSSKSKFQLTGVYPSNFCFTLKFNPGSTNNTVNTFGWVIGYRLGSYKTITSSIESEGLFDGGGDRYVYVSVEDYQKNNNTLNMVCFDESIMEKNIIAKIPMVDGKLSLIVDDNTAPLSKIRRYNGPVNLRNLFIRILDQFGQVVDLNNMDFSFTLELEILYEGFNFQNINN